jgi:hypothetical protein
MKYIYRVVVTSRYKKYCPAILVGWHGIGNGLVTGLNLVDSGIS